MGPLLFSLGIMKLMKSRLSLWYLDDATLAGAPDVVLRDLDKIAEAADTLGLEMNPGKCELYFTNEANEEKDSVVGLFNQKAPGIKVKTKENLTLLGAPIHPEASKSVLQEKLEDLERMSERLEMLDTHSALYLLKNVYSIPKLTYFLRTAPFFKHPDSLELYNDQLRRSLETLNNFKLEDMQWTQSTLPVAFGGLGIRCATEVPFLHSYPQPMVLRKA